MFPVLRPVFVFAALAGFVACHSAHAAEPVHAASPAVEIEVEDRAPGGPAHVARFGVSVTSGSGELLAHDGDAKYAVEARAVDDADPKLALRIHRHDRGVSAEIDVQAAIPKKPGGRVVLARIDRADGRTTTVTAQAR